MLQRQIRHDPGSFPACATCGREPRHIQARGSLSTERWNALPTGGVRHTLECACGVRTPWLDTLEQAHQHWRTAFAVPPPRPENVRSVLHLHKVTR